MIESWTPKNSFWLLEKNPVWLKQIYEVLSFLL
jgi:hypothetical protein